VRHQNHPFCLLGKSHLSVSSEFIDHIQQAGYRVLHARVATVPRRGTRRAWIECRKHEPGENDVPDEEDETIAENNEFALTPRGAYTGTIAESADQFTLTCPKCEEDSHRTLPERLRFSGQARRATPAPGADAGLTDHRRRSTRTNSRTLRIRTTKNLKHRFVIAVHP
jgi:hypothetical protein